VLGVLLRLVLVEQGENLPHHHAHRVLAEVLRDADKTDARLAQAAHMIFEREMVAGEAAEGMDDDDVEGRIACRRHVEKALQLGATVVRAAGSRLDEFDGDFPAAGGAVAKRLSPLVGDGEVAFGLPSRRDTQIEGRATGGGCFSLFFCSQAHCRRPA
jgi:hypothetical protein